MTPTVPLARLLAPWKRWRQALPRLLPLDGRGSWLLCALLAIDVVATAIGTYLPIRHLPREYVAVWIPVVAAGLLVASFLSARFRPSTRRLRPVEVLAILAIATMVLTDVTMATGPMRDLGIYIKAGQHFQAGSPVYLSSPLAANPADLSDLPYLYPPFTLPFFGVLARLPVPLVQVGWLVGSICLGVQALRWMGLPGRWALFALVWPPIFQGLWVGNVAVPALALFAVGPWLGSGLILSAVFKLYTGISSLWLIRERRWVEVGVGIVALLVLTLATLPLTGVDLWSRWFEGLRNYQASQIDLPALYGFGLARYIPYAAYLGCAVLAIVAALLVRGRELLARLGTATIVASPSLFGHGLLVAVPSLLSLRSPWLWLAIGLSSTPQGPQTLLAVGVILISWAAPTMRRQAISASVADESLHPLGNDGEVWPDAKWSTEPDPAR